MSLNRNEKQTVVTDVAAQVARSQTLALAEYQRLLSGIMVKLHNVWRGRGEPRAAKPGGGPTA